MGQKSEFVYTEATYTYHLLKEKQNYLHLDFDYIYIYIYIGVVPKEWHPKMTIEDSFQIII